MGLKIYKEINNNTPQDNEKDIILEFVCNVKLYDADEIFRDCLNYDSDNDDFYNVSEVYYFALKDALDNLQRIIIQQRGLESNPSRDSYISEADRCYKVLSKALEGMNSGFFMLFI